MHGINSAEALALRPVATHVREVLGQAATSLAKHRTDMFAFSVNGNGRFRGDIRIHPAGVRDHAPVPHAQLRDALAGMQGLKELVDGGRITLTEQATTALNDATSGVSRLVTTLDTLRSQAGVSSRRTDQFRRTESWPIEVSKWSRAGISRPVVNTAVQAFQDAKVLENALLDVNTSSEVLRAAQNDLATLAASSERAAAIEGGVQRAQLTVAR